VYPELHVHTPFTKEELAGHALVQTPFTKEYPELQIQVPLLKEELAGQDATQTPLKNPKIHTQVLPLNV